MSTPSRGRRISAWVLTGLLTALFVGSAAGKLAGAAQVVEMMQKWGLGDQVLLYRDDPVPLPLLAVAARTCPATSAAANARS
jgi:hypothetical protein